jgi:hypothetical protein
MSNAALTAVWSQSKSERTARLILLSIADRSDDAGRAYCGAQDLCRRANAGRRTVFEALRELRELGELTVLPDKGPRGCNRYQINLEWCGNGTSAETALVRNLHASSAKSAPKPNRTQYSKKEDGFAEFWEAYPRKEKKPRALKAWRATAKDRPTIATLLEILAKHAAGWNDSKFIPHPATWLNDHSWEDKLNTPAPAARRRSSL